MMTKIFEHVADVCDVIHLAHAKYISLYCFDIFGGQIPGGPVDHSSPECGKKMSCNREQRIYRFQKPDSQSSQNFLLNYYCGDESNNGNVSIVNKTLLEEEKPRLSTANGGGFTAKSATPPPHNYTPTTAVTVKHPQPENNEEQIYHSSPLKLFLLLMALCGIIVLPKPLAHRKNKKRLERQASIYERFFICSKLRLWSLCWSSAMILLHTMDMAVTTRHMWLMMRSYFTMLDPTMLSYTAIMLWRLDIYAAHLYLYVMSVTGPNRLRTLVEWQRLVKSAAQREANPSVAQVHRECGRRLQWIAIVSSVAISCSYFAVLCWFNLNDPHELIQIPAFGRTVDFHIFNPWPPTHTLSTFGTIHLGVFTMLLALWWILPVVFYAATCALLRRALKRFALNARLKIQIAISSTCNDERTKTVAEELEALRMEHFRLCSLVKLADRAAAPMAGVLAAVLVPSTCVIMYLIRKSATTPIGGANEAWRPIEATLWYWAAMSVFAITSLTIAGGLVSEAVTAARDTIAGVLLPKNSWHGSLALIALHMQVSDTTSTGMTAGHVFTLNKKSLLTLAGVFSTYFVLLMQFGDQDQQHREVMQVLGKVVNATVVGRQ